MTFPIPDLQKYYKSNPGHYLGHLIGHEGPGSLLSELKSKGKAESRAKRLKYDVKVVLSSCPTSMVLQFETFFSILQ